MTEAQNKAASPVQPFKMMDGTTLFDLPPEPDEYCVEGLMPTGGISLLAGKPKAGKSSLARQLTVAVAQGNSFLGRETTQGAVLYFGMEEHANWALEHFKSLGMTAKDPIYTLFNAVNKQAAIAMLAVTLEAIKDVKLIVIDPVFKFVSVHKSDDYMEVSNGLEPLQTLARKHHAHVLVVHHLKKAATEDRMDGILGSTAILGGVDTAIALTKDGRGIREICSVQRYGDNIEPTQLMWNPETLSMSLGSSAEEVAQEEKQQTVEQINGEIIQYVHDHPGCNQQAIHNAVHGKSTTKKRCLQMLIDQSIVFDITGAGVKGDPFGYTLQDVPRAESSKATSEDKEMSEAA